MIYWQNVVESFDFAYHRGIDNKFTYTLHWAQILLILCKRPNKVYIIKMLKHQAQADFGATFGSISSAFDIDTKLPRYIATFNART